MNGPKHRKEERGRYPIPAFIYGEFTVKKAPEQAKIYDLKVLNGSNRGLGVVVTQKDFELIETLHPGDKIKDLSFFTTWTAVTVDGTVRHKTKIKEGKYKGCYLLGIEASEFIENCRPPKDE